MTIEQSSLEQIKTGTGTTPNKPSRPKASGIGSAAFLANHRNVYLLTSILLDGDFVI